MYHLSGTRFLPTSLFEFNQFDDEITLRAKHKYQKDKHEEISAALEADDVDAFENSVIEFGVGIEEYFSQCGSNCLRTAIEWGSSQITNYLLTQPPRDIVEEIVNKKHRFFGSAAIVAACDTETENLALVHTLLDCGARVGIPQALAAAARRGHMEIVRALMNLAAHEDRGLAVRSAAASGHTDIVKELVQHKVMRFLDSELRIMAPLVKMFVNEDKYGDALNESLRLAAEGGDLEMVQVLLKAGAYEGQPSAEKGNVHPRPDALAGAATKGYVNIVEALLKFKWWYVDNNHLGSILIDAVANDQRETAAQIADGFDVSIMLSRVLREAPVFPQNIGKAVKFLMGRNPDLSRALDHLVRNAGNPNALLLLGAPASQPLVSAARNNDAVRVKQAVLCDETATLALIHLAKAQETEAADFLVTEASARESAAAALINLALCGDTSALPVIAPLADAGAAYEKLASRGNSDAIHMLVSAGLPVPETLLEHLLEMGNVAAVRTLIKCEVSTVTLMHTLYGRYQQGDPASRQAMQLLIAYGADASMLSPGTVDQLMQEMESQKADFLSMSENDKIQFFEDISDRQDAIGLSLLLDHKAGFDALSFLKDTMGLYSITKQTIRDYIFRACMPTSDEIESLSKAGKLAVIQTFAHPDVLAQHLIRYVKNRDDEAVKELMSTLTDGGSALAAAAMNNDGELLDQLSNLNANGLEAVRLLLRELDPLCESASRLIARGLDINDVLNHILVSPKSYWYRGEHELRLIGAIAEEDADDADRGEVDSEAEYYADF